MGTLEQIRDWPIFHMIGRSLTPQRDLVPGWIGVRWRAVLAAVALCFSPLAVAKVAATEAQFLKENDAAMSKMMAAMTIRPTGDTDRDFVAMMIPHHQGAIDMAQIELRHGHNEQLRRIAQEIIVEQQQEIVAMRLAVDQKLPAPAAAPDQPSDVKTSPRRSSDTPVMKMSPK